MSAMLMTPMSYSRLLAKVYPNCLEIFMVFLNNVQDFFVPLPAAWTRTNALHLSSPAPFLSGKNLTMPPD
jgi:hypothetical protein